MENYILYSGNIDGQFREVQIYPILTAENTYLVHWDGHEIGKIIKIDGKWFTDSNSLLEVTNELGAFLDSNEML